MSREHLNDDGWRQLWAAVVLSAADDLRDERIGSIYYNQAKAFFIAHGPWAERRAEIANMLDLHSDDLSRLGHAILAERGQTASQPVKQKVELQTVERCRTEVTPLVIPDCLRQILDVRSKPHRWRQDGEAAGNWVRRFARV